MAYTAEVDTTISSVAFESILFNEYKQKLERVQQL